MAEDMSMAALVAVGVAANGERRILGLELSAGNDEGFAWPRFVRSLVERGLHGVRLVISDSHAGGRGGVEHRRLPACRTRRTAAVAGRS